MRYIRAIVSDAMIYIDSNTVQSDLSGLFFSDAPGPS